MMKSLLPIGTLVKNKQMFYDDLAYYGIVIGHKDKMNLVKWLINKSMATVHATSSLRIVTND